MKLTNIDLYSAGSLVTNFSFRDPALSDQYLVKGVTGLDAESIVPKLFGRSMFTKKPYYNMAMEPRNVVLRLTVNPDYSFSDSYGSLRDHIYRAIAASRSGQVELRFNGLNTAGGGVTFAYVRGRVTKFEASHSTNQPEIQLTITCKDARLQSVDLVEEDPDLLSTINPIITDDLSTAPHGCQFEFVPTEVMTYILIEGSESDDDTDWFFKVQPGTIGGLPGFRPSDIVTVVSEPGRYSVRLRRGSTLYSIADRIAVGSLWPTIYPGTNNWTIDTGGADFDWNEFVYRNTYWGV